jgi:SAM-dependent methyltransferase
LITAIIIICIFLAYLHLSNLLSYTILKNRILKKKKWGLNICCGKTDGGGINADIVKHKDVPSFVYIEDIYNLPFKEKEFDTVISSHTIEHVDDPKRFYSELNRVGKEVTLVLPPLWDFSAALNFLEHKYIFLCLRKTHKKLPPFVPLPLSSFYHKRFGQKIKA